MRKWIVLTAVLTLVLTSGMASAAFRGGSGEPPPNGEERAGVLYLFQKTPLPASPDSGPWPIVPGGAWGMMRYNLWGDEFKFDFKGRRLAPRTGYTLIYYPDPWPGDGLICLATGRTNPAGNITLADFDFDIGTSLPAKGDANFSPIPPSGAVGAKIWLVLSEDVQCEGPTRMINWTPDKYLFEFNLINFEYREPKVTPFR
jgi:hypothetical protein